MSIISNIATVGGVVTLGAGVIPAAATQVSSEKGFGKMLGSWGETIGKFSTSALDKVGIGLGSDAKNAALLGAIAAAVLGGVAYITRDKDHDGEVTSQAGLPGPGPMGGGRGNA